LYAVCYTSFYPGHCKFSATNKLCTERFSQEVPSALFASRLLDSFYTEKVLPGWYIENDNGASKFWHSYLVYRAHNDIHHLHRRYVNIHEVAERVCKETGADLEVTVEALCWPALQQGTNPGSDSKLEKEPPDPRLDLLCAAAYLNHIPIAKQLLQEGVCPHSESHLFSSPMYLAAWAGNAQMLELFQAHVPEMEGYDPVFVFNHNWRGKIGPASIKGAARRGELDMVRLAVYPPSRAAPDSTDFAGEPFGSVSRSSSTGNALALAQWETRDVDVYKYLENFFTERAHLSHALPRHARLGNLDMVRYLLDSGADIHGIGRRDGNPLVEACRRCHEDVVDLLLERGADPNFNGDKDRAQGDIAIVAAARSGSLFVVRKLIDHGAELSRMDMGVEMGFRALQAAVHLEHTDMVKFLLASGVDLAVCGEMLIQSASRNGFDSMVELLQRESATIS